MRIFLAGLLLLGACGDDLLGGVDGVVSGDRLRARYRQDAGGTKIFLGFRDTALGIDCQFEEVVDGARCVPEVAQTILFADPGCLNPVLWDSPCLPWTHVGLWSRDTCTPRLEEVWEIGEVRLLPQAYVWNGACVESSGGPRTYRVVGAPVPLGTFARARVETDGGSSRLRRLSYRGEDGARATAGARDTDLGFDCVDTTDPCMPRTAYDSNAYETDACTQRLAIEATVCADGVDHVLLENRLFELAGKVEPELVHFAYEDACAAEPAVEGLQYFRFGDQLARARLAVTERAVEDPMARVSQYERRTADGFRTRDVGLHDNELDVACELRRVADGEWRCLPVAAYGYAELAYADAACTEPLELATARIDGGILDGVIVERADACDTVAEVHAVVPAPDTPFYRINSEGICTFWGVDPAWYSVVAEQLSLDPYAAFHDVME